MKEKTYEPMSATRQACRWMEEIDDLAQKKNALLIRAEQALKDALVKQNNHIQKIRAEDSIPYPKRNILLQSAYAISNDLAAMLADITYNTHEMS